MDAQLQTLLRRYNADPCLENADALIRAYQRGHPLPQILERPLSADELRQRAIDFDDNYFEVSEVIKVSIGEVLEGGSDYSEFLDLLSNMVASDTYVTDIDWHIVAVGAYNELYIQVNGLIEDPL